MAAASTKTNPPDHNNPLKVRRIALDILNNVEQDNRTLDSILEDVLERQPLSDRRDRALLHALVFGILRWRGRLDYVISSFSRTRLKKIDPEVLNIIRKML